MPSSTRVEAAVAIGSIASGGRENTEAVISHGAVLKLLEAVESPDAALVEASLRSLKFIVNNSPTMEVNIPVRAVSLHIKNCLFETLFQSARVLFLACAPARPDRRERQHHRACRREPLARLFVWRDARYVFVAQRTRHTFVTHLLSKRARTLLLCQLCTFFCTENALFIASRGRRRRTCITHGPPRHRVAAQIDISSTSWYYLYSLFTSLMLYFILKTI